MSIKKFKVTIGGVKKTVVSIEPEIESSIKSNLPTHHIFMIDRSGSMEGSISLLVDQLHNAVDLLSPDDIVTISWFSGVGSWKIIVQASPVTETVHRTIDSLRSTLGCTCFSEIFADIGDVSLALKDLTDHTIIHLFTDGQPVVPWSIEEEVNRVMDIVYDICHTSNVIAVNTIGYGNYYNHEMLVDISSISEFGQMTHTSDIRSYYDLIEHSILVSSGLVASSIQVNSEGNEILYASKITSLQSDSLSLNRLDKEKNRIYVIVEDSSSIISINGSDYSLSDIQQIAQKDDATMVADFFFAYADQLYYHGHRQEALDIIVNNAKDRYIANMMVNAFTNDEVAEVQISLRMANDNTYRYLDGTTGPGFLPKKDAFCLMDLFTSMINSSNDNFYLPLSPDVPAYERITRKVTDQHDLFTASTDEVATKISDLVWNKDKMNLSIKFKINGTVNLNPRSADTVKLERIYPSCIFRTHSFVKDGQLNIKLAEFRVSGDIHDLLIDKAFKSICQSVESEDGKTWDMVINLSKLPVINRTYIDNSDCLDDLFAITKRIVAYEATQKSLGIIIDKIYENGSKTLKKTGEYRKLTVDQIRVLEEHGIRSDGIYGGVDNTRPSAKESDSYRSRSIVFQLKGAASLPTTKDFLDMVSGKKKPNLAGKMMIEAYNYTIGVLGEDNIAKPTIKTLNAANEILREVSCKLQADRQYLASLKLAKILTGDFFHGLILDDKGNYSHTVGEETMVVKTEYKTQYF